MVHLLYRMLFSWLKFKVLKFTSEWIELKGIILSEVTQTQKENIACFYLFVYSSFESLDMCIWVGIPMEIRDVERVMGKGDIGLNS